ncbi:hypothetical protein [Microbacterium paraoxydans]|uniref:hypothetical protein n=1 Tax=Microbacterium paraoxydans TaxID=199592 RepID=UPI003D737144
MNTTPAPRLRSRGAAPQPVESRERFLSISSVVIAVVSLVCGFALFPPLVGVIAGLLGRQREPRGQVIAAWGIALNLVVLLGWVALLAVLVLTGVLTQLLHP